MTPEFEQVVRLIWQTHRSRNILTQCLGPDPVLFAESVIEAWQKSKNNADCQQIRNSENTKNPLTSSEKSVY